MEQLQTHRYYDTETKEYYERVADQAGVTQERERRKRLAKAEESGEKLKEIDDILDEIDEILEENAEQFVASYIQKGGE